MLPLYSLPIDSVWKSYFEIEADMKDFVDTVNCRITDYNAGEYTIEARSQKLLPVTNKSYYFNGVAKPGYIESSDGGGYYIMKLNAKGIITSAMGDFVVKTNSKVDNEKFVEKIRTKLNYTYIGQYRL